MRKIVFCDFDGTITEHDTLDAVQDVYGPKDWREQYAKMRREGMTSRDVTRKVLETCKASPAEVERLIAGIGIRAGFEEFVKFARGHGYEFTITSEGIDLSIRVILHARGLDDIPYFTNRFVIDAKGRPSTAHEHSHPDCPVCGNCKAWHLVKARKHGFDRLTPGGTGIVYIGDAGTDRCPSMLADIVFARPELGEWCAAKKIEFIPFEDFHDIIAEFSKGDFEERLEAASKRDVERKLALPTQDYFEKHEAIRSPVYKSKGHD